MMASVVVGGNRKTSLTLRGVDPETCMIVFKNHWAQVVKILERHEPGRSSTGALGFLSGHMSISNGGSGSGSLRLGPIPADEASAVQNYVEHMLFLLMEEEAGKGGAMGPILEFVVVEAVMERLFLWSLRRHFTEDMKLEQLRMYQMLLSQAKQPLLHHKPVLRPLMMLLASCAGPGPGPGPGPDSGGVVEAELVLLLYQLCVALVKDSSVLELFFHTSEDQGAANFLLFSLLIPYTHRQGSVGQQARDALLLIMTLSESEPRVARHISDNTYFCPVLATGLSGLYSSLPARLQVYSEDWCCLEPHDWQQVPALVHFLNSLDFCSAVTKVAHPSVRSQLLSYIYNGFLVPVLAPALHKLTLEEAMTTTAYLDLFLRSIFEPALLQIFLSFILLHAHDGVQILDTLVSRVNTPFQLGTVSLALFRTLIGLFCEDVMLQLVFRYLIPCSHLSRKQRSSLNQRDCHASGATSFLLLMPSWCPVNLHSELIHWAKGADPSVSDSVGYCRGSDFLMDVNYLHYLLDARQAIFTSDRACRLWSAPYDGIDPSPEQSPSDTPGGGVKEEEDEEEDEEILQRVASLPSLAVSPTPSSTDKPTGRVSSALELEWDDDIFDEPSSPPPPPPPPPPLPPLPPQHIQEMQRSAIKLVNGSYVEESEFQDDVLVYDLVARTDARAAVLERTVAANHQRRSVARGHRASATMLAKRRRSEYHGMEVIRMEEEEEGEKNGSEQVFTNGFDRNGHVVAEDEQETDDRAKRRPSNASRNKDAEQRSALLSETTAAAASGSLPDNSDFLSQYHQLMLSLGAEPDFDDITDNMGAFRRRVRALRKRLEEEDDDDEGLGEESFFSSSMEDSEEEEEEEEGEETRRQGVPFTGPFISVLLSRLENLLENSIAVNLLVTGILAQLASYPQPLLRSFLLSTDTKHRQTNVRTLYQVLASVRDQIERYVASRPEYPGLVAQAWRFLLAKDQESKFRESLESHGGAINEPRLPNGSVRKRLAPPPVAVLPPCPSIPPQAKSRVFAVVLFAEFLKELAAVAQEHSVAPH